MFYKTFYYRRNLVLQTTTNEVVGTHITIYILLSNNPMFAPVAIVSHTVLKRVLCPEGVLVPGVAHGDASEVCEPVLVPVLRHLLLLPVHLLDQLLPRLGVRLRVVGGLQQLFLQQESLQEGEK